MLTSLALAMALLCWPHRPARVRVAVLRGVDGLPRCGQVCGAGGPSRCGQVRGVVGPCRCEPMRGVVVQSRFGRVRHVVGQPWVLVATGLAGCLGLLVAGPAGALAAAVAAGTAVGRWRARRRAAQALAATADLAAVLALLAAELRAGAHPAAAASRVAADGGPVAAAVLGSVAATARLCGDVGATLRQQSAAMPDLARPLDQLAAAWAMASRHGIPLADVLDAVRGDLDHQVRSRRRLRASLAGPRATAAVLAGLPVLGLLLGQAVGAQPWRVLTEVAAGQLLLVLGTLLICAGLAWSGRLVTKVAAP